MLSTVNQQKLKWFGHVVRHDTLPKTILQGYVECGERRDKLKKNWVTNEEEWTGCSLGDLRRAKDGPCWREFISPALHQISPTTANVNASSVSGGNE